MTPQISYAERALLAALSGGPGATPFVDCATHLTTVVSLEDGIDKDALRSAIALVGKRHAILLSRYLEKGCSWTRASLSVDELAAGLEVVDCGSDAELKEVQAYAGAPFDLASGPALRACTFTSGGNRMVAITMHHVLCDTWSMQLVASDCAAAYRSVRSGDDEVLTPPTATYDAYVEAERRRLDGSGVGARARERLAHLRAVSGHCFSNGAVVAAPSKEAVSIRFAIPKDDATNLFAVAKQRRATVAVCLLTVYVQLLSELTCADAIAIGVPTSERWRRGFEGVVGLFTNAVVVRAPLSRQASFSQVLECVRAAFIDAMKHEDLPIGYLHELAGERLYRVAFNYVPTDRQPVTRIGGSSERINVNGHSVTEATSELTLHVYHVDNELRCRIVGRADVFRDAQLRALRDRVLELVSQVGRA